MPGEVTQSKNSVRGQFLLWLERIELSKENHWKRIGIYDAIQVSKQNLLYNIPQLVSYILF